jgi:flagellar protein FliO/FliZ
VIAGRARGRAALVALAGAGVVALGVFGGEAARTAARATLAAGALAAAAALARRRGPTCGREGAPPALSVVARAPLGRDAGVALVEVTGRRVLLGYGAQGVRLVVELDAGADGGAL